MFKGANQEAVIASCDITIINPLGFHARPAAEFVRRAHAFRCEIWLITRRGRFSALSLIDVMRANLECGATVRLEAIGPDAEAAVKRLAEVAKTLRD